MQNDAVMQNDAKLRRIPFFSILYDMLFQANQKVNELPDGFYLPNYLSRDRCTQLAILLQSSSVLRIIRDWTVSHLREPTDWINTFALLL